MKFTSGVDLDLGKIRIEDLESIKIRSTESRDLLRHRLVAFKDSLTLIPKP